MDKISRHSGLLDTDVVERCGLYISLHKIVAQKKSLHKIASNTVVAVN